MPSSSKPMPNLCSCHALATFFKGLLNQRFKEFVLQVLDFDFITAREEERLVDLFKILRAYNEVDDLPAELLTTNATKKMSDILQSLNELIDKTK